MCRSEYSIPSATEVFISLSTIVGMHQCAENVRISTSYTNFSAYLPVSARSSQAEPSQLKKEESRNIDAD
jgi:hypothetical protein